MSQTQLPTTPNLSTGIRQRATHALNRIGLWLHRRGIHPDAITLLGLLITLGACFVIIRGQFVLGAVILIVGLPLDALDGAVARAMGRTNPFGGVFDSAIDRYADMLILLAMAYYFAGAGLMTEVGLTFWAVIGSVMVSYIRARAGSAGLPCAGGFFSRFERLAVLLLTLLTGWIVVGLAILAVGANYTALHRLWSVYRFANAAEAAPTTPPEVTEDTEEGV